MPKKITSQNDAKLYLIAFSICLLTFFFNVNVDQFVYIVIVAPSRGARCRDDFSWERGFISGSFVFVKKGIAT
jgi:hypothetical protein